MRAASRSSPNVRRKSAKEYSLSFEQSKVVRAEKSLHRATNRIARRDNECVTKSALLRTSYATLFRRYCDSQRFERRGHFAPEEIFSRFFVCARTSTSQLSRATPEADEPQRRCSPHHCPLTPTTLAPTEVPQLSVIVILHCLAGRRNESIHAVAKSWARTFSTSYRELLLLQYRK